MNLYYDGEYRGVYLLSEKNAVKDTGIDITDLEAFRKQQNAEAEKRRLDVNSRQWSSS